MQGVEFRSIHFSILSAEPRGIAGTVSLNPGEFTDSKFQLLHPAVYVSYNPDCVG